MLLTILNLKKRLKMSKYKHNNQHNKQEMVVKDKVLLDIYIVKGFFSRLKIVSNYSLCVSALV